MADDAGPTVGTADTVNIGAPSATVPHVRILAAITIAILVGFSVVSLLVLIGAAGIGIDAATKGALIQTWSNLALMGGAFWLGSSMSGKTRGASQ